VTPPLPRISSSTSQNEFAPELAGHVADELLDARRTDIEQLRGKLDSGRSIGAGPHSLAQLVGALECLQARGDQQMRAGITPKRRDLRRIGLVFVGEIADDQQQAAVGRLHVPVFVMSCNTSRNAAGRNAASSNQLRARVPAPAADSRRSNRDRRQRFR